jgi:plastocyanin
VNYQFTPATITVKHGDTITVSDTNPSTPHTFTIKGTNIDVANNAMQSQDVVIDLKPGTYDFFCKYHASRGMTGTLTVT